MRPSSMEGRLMGVALLPGDFTFQQGLEGQGARGAQADHHPPAVPLPGCGKESLLGSLVLSLGGDRYVQLPPALAAPSRATSF
jgi:hypothetical protein